MKIMQINCENLAIHFDKNKPQDIQKISESEWQKMSIRQQPNKPLNKTIGLAEAILDEKPDIIALCEVMGFDSVSNFNKYFLNNEYTVLYNDTNSKRGIDLAFLVKKSLINIKFEILSHKKRKVIMDNGEERFFSRDIAELQIKENNLVKAVILSVHLKSQLSSESDFQGQNVRKAELKSLVDLYLELESLYENTPILLMGDFNGNATKDFYDPEFFYLYDKTSLIDIHDIKQSNQLDRTSHVYFTSFGEASYQQLDYIFCNQKARDCIDLNNTYAYRFKHFGYPWPLIKTMKEKWELPSDHYPQVICINL
jgi:endonuclease/exonuclease/phosphatase family metal-dependent hydrolase